MLRNTYEEQSGDLEKVVYSFGIIDNTIHLNSMIFLERKTKRHSWKKDNSKSYERLDNRNNGIKEEPDVPIEIGLAALDHYKSLITFKKWKRR